MPAPTRYRAFRQLHVSGCFVIPNPWDIGSAKLLAQLGFKALATTSSGFAWSLGRRDGRITIDQSLSHLRAMSASVDVPVNADFENAFAVEPEEVAANVTRAVETGVAGLSVEDSTGDPSRPLFDFALAVDRVLAARQAIDASGGNVLLTARAENHANLAERIKRLTAFAQAGADCLFAPGLRTIADVRAVVSAVAPKPVNVLVSSDFTTVAELTDVGVRRISVGGALARSAWAGFFRAAREIADHGTFTAVAAGTPSAEMERAFADD
jgi:2-methylisocitrate lyase-like PEP mutase family enzyme